MTLQPSHFLHFSTPFRAYFLATYLPFKCDNKSVKFVVSSSWFLNETESREKKEAYSNCPDQ